MNNAAQSRDSTPAGAEVKSKPKPKTASALIRIKLALLDQYAVQLGEKSGSDPYNTTSAGTAKPDHWRGNARRI